MRHDGLCSVLCTRCPCCLASCAPRSYPPKPVPCSQEREACVGCYKENQHVRGSKATCPLAQTVPPRALPAHTWLRPKPMRSPHAAPCSPAPRRTP